MEQKLYNYEIVLNLINKENHLRGISRDIRINHMTVKRVLDNLIEKNVVDVRIQGKNNVYSIKKSVEAQNVVFMSELYKFERLIEKHPELKYDVKELKKLNVKLIVLFGSYAKGIETEKSDIDIYIETKNEEIKKIASSINKRFNIKIGSYNKDNLLIKEIENQHIIIKGVEAFYEKNKFFD